MMCARFTFCGTISTSCQTTQGFALAAADPYEFCKTRGMNSDTRHAVAYIAARIASGESSSAVYDHSSSKWISMGGTVSDAGVNIFDYERGSHVWGSGTNGSLSLYDFGRGGHIQLNVNGDKFDGFDYITSHHFSGTIRGRSVSFYDYGASQYFNYSI